MLFLMISSVALSQVYDDFDSNSDKSLDRNEFNETYSENYDQWDRNADGAVDDREFYDTNYDRLDQNSDRYLSADEWNRGYDDIYGEYLATRDYNQFDTDGDSDISNDEFYEGMKNTDYYNTYDSNRDQNIDTDEMNEGVFEQWDENRDNNIDEYEFNDTSDYWLDFEYQKCMIRKEKPAVFAGFFGAKFERAFFFITRTCSLKIFVFTCPELQEC